MSSNFSGFQAFPTHREASWLNNTDQPSFWTHLTIWNHPTHPSESNHLTILTILTQHWIWIKLTTGSSLKSRIWPLTIWLIILETDPLAQLWRGLDPSFGSELSIWTEQPPSLWAFQAILPSKPLPRVFCLPGGFLCLAFDRYYRLLVCLVIHFCWAAVQCHIIVFWLFVLTSECLVNLRIFKSECICVQS